MRITSRHPEIKTVLTKWERARVLIEEDEDKYSEAEYFIRLPKETLTAYKEREPTYMSGFINIAGSLLRIKGDTIYQRDVKREGLSSMQKAFVDRADMSGQKFAEIMQNEVAPALSGYGTVFAVLDKPALEAANRLEEETRGVPYITILSPFQVVDFEWDKDGSLKWFQYTTSDESPREAPDGNGLAAAKYEEKLVTWTRDEYIVRGTKGHPTRTPNPFGFVPVVIQAQFVDPNKTLGKTSFFATSRYIFSANNLSCASNFEVYKGSSSTLLMNVQDLDESDGQTSEVSPDSNLKKIKKERDEANVLVYQNSGDKPAYLEQPLDLIDAAAKRADKYFEMALDNEKSALSVTTAQMPSSGISKAYDFTSVNGVLSACARALQRFEDQAIRMVGRMSGQLSPNLSITYPQDFDIRSYNDKLAFVKGLMDAKFPSVLGMRDAYKSLTPEITENTTAQGKINAEIDIWTPTEQNNQPPMNAAMP
jgi:hypothetical protein